jgi:hypothetical protein
VGCKDAGVRNERGAADSGDAGAWRARPNPLPAPRGGAPARPSPRPPPPPTHPQERHADELRDFQQKLVAKATQPRHSREYYNLREIQERLAHSKNYAGAAKIKEKADELMAFEEEKWNNEKQLEMLHKENVFKARLAMEAEALRKRVAQGRAEQNRARQKALEMVLQRYYNVKAGMESEHALQALKFDREAATRKKA